MNRESFVLILFIVFISYAVNVSGDVGVKTGKIAGKILYNGNPVAEGMLYGFNAKKKEPGPTSMMSPDFITKINQDGIFMIEVPEGEYYLRAVKRQNKNVTFGPPMEGDIFFGLEFISQGKKGRTLLVEADKIADLGIIEANAFHVPPVINKSDSRESTIQVKVTGEDGKPVKDAYLYLFKEKEGLNPNIEKVKSAADFVIGPTNNDGLSEADVPQGKYYYEVIKRFDPYVGIYGPPMSDDLYFFRSESIEIVKEKRGLVKIEAILSKFAEPSSASGFIIKGRVTDANGNPAKGIIVGAYIGPNATGRPINLTRTRQDGTYTLRLLDAGTYYLRVLRNPGQPIGFYGSMGPEPVKVRTGKPAENINIIAEEKGVIK